MLVIGSEALKHWGCLPPNRIETMSDFDIICSWEDFQKYIQPKMTTHYPLDSKHWFCREVRGGRIIEVEIAWPGSAAEALLEHEQKPGPNRLYAYALPATCLALKLSHRYLKDSPHFHKTRNDILFLRDKGVELDDWLENWLPWREKETYTYEHPKLNQSKKAFFTDEVKYKYDHDSIHEAVAVLTEPVYKRYLKPGAEVECDMNKFVAMTHGMQIRAVYEEAAVLAIERALVPHRDRWKDPMDAFEFALQKVATSITSGVFREFAWENFNEIVKFAHSCQLTFWERFNMNLERGLVKEAS